MSAILGPYLIDDWNGPPPPQIKPVIVTQFRPGQAAAAAKILQQQSHASNVEMIQFTSTGTVGGFASPDLFVDSLRAVIGTQLALTWRGLNYGSVLVGDIQPVAIETIQHAAGTHPDGTAYEYSPATRIATAWQLLRVT